MTTHQTTSSSAREAGLILIQINYLASDDKTILTSHRTNDEWSKDQRTEWEEWLNDSAVEHPGEPEEWSSFRLVSYRWSTEGDAQ